MVWQAFEFSNYLAKRIKEKDPSILTIAGGFHVTLYEEDFLKNSNFDLGVASDGEKPLKIILDIANKNLKNWDKKAVLAQIKGQIKTGKLKNMIWRDKNKIKKTERFFPT